MIGFNHLMGHFFLLPDDFSSVFDGPDFKEGTNYKKIEQSVK